MSRVWSFSITQLTEWKARSNKGFIPRKRPFGGNAIRNLSENGLLPPREELKKYIYLYRQRGFGRDKSTGKGYFTFKVNEGIDIEEAGNPNAFMTLTSFIPKEKTPWKVTTTPC